MIPMSHLSFVQCEQIKFRPQKNVKMKVSHSVVAVGIVAGRGDVGGDSCHVTHDMNFCNFLVLPFLIKPNIFNNLK